MFDWLPTEFKVLWIVSALISLALLAGTVFVVVKILVHFGIL